MMLLCVEEVKRARLIIQHSKFKDPFHELLGQELARSFPPQQHIHCAFTAEVVCMESMPSVWQALQEGDAAAANIHPQFMNDLSQERIRFEQRVRRICCENVRALFEF